MNAEICSRNNINILYLRRRACDIIIERSGGRRRVLVALLAI